MPQLSIQLLLQIGLLIVSGVLVLLILLQQRGTGLGSAFGSGEGNVFATRRGIERWLFIAAVAFSVFYLAGTLAYFLLV